MLQFPEGLDARQFLAQYWQKRPLVFRQGLNSATDIISVSELFALACDTEVESRLIQTANQEQDYGLEHGPFVAEELSQLTNNKYWTILVQSVNIWHKKVASVLSDFDFIPTWRLDDIMISYATDYGSVGPHIDAYDVFLVQIHGTRHWRVAGNEATPENHMTDCGLSLVDDFAAELDVSLEPGDILYLPPNLAHHGISEGDGMTLSVGFRSPSLSQLSMLVTEGFIEVDRQYRDPDFSEELITKGEISQAAMQNAHKFFQEQITPKATAIAFGKLQTQPKTDLILAPLAVPPHEHLTSGGTLSVDPAARIAWWLSEEEIHLFSNGEHTLFPQNALTIIKLLCSAQAIDLNMLSAYIEDLDCIAVLEFLDDTGYLGIELNVDETNHL